MLNHFRTLLLNLTYLDASEHIPEAFTAKALPSELKRVYDKLFPPGSSRFYKLFLGQNYLNIVKTTGFQDYVTALDNRISYDLSNDSYFKVTRVSNPIVSNAQFPIKVLSSINSVAYSDYHFDSFLISQVTNSLNVRVYSRMQERYLNGKEEYVTSADSGTLIPVQFTAGNKTSDTILIGQTGASFNITNLSNGAFTATSNKTWEFVVESPYSFNVLSIISQVDRVDIFKQLNKFVDVKALEGQWEQEQNPLYRFALILIAYVSAVNTL